MTQSLRAVFEQGVLRPLEPVPLKENQQVTITLSDSDNGEWTDSAFLRAIESDADDSISLNQVRAGLAKIVGAMSADFHREREERS